VKSKKPVIYLKVDQSLLRERPPVLGPGFAHLLLSFQQFQHCCIETSNIIQTKFTRILHWV